MHVERPLGFFAVRRMVLVEEARSRSHSCKASYEEGELPPSLRTAGDGQGRKIIDERTPVDAP